MARRRVSPIRCWRRAKSVRPVRERDDLAVDGEVRARLCGERLDDLRIGARRVGCRPARAAERARSPAPPGPGHRPASARRATHQGSRAGRSAWRASAGRPVPRRVTHPGAAVCGVRAANPGDRSSPLTSFLRRPASGCGRCAPSGPGAGRVWPGRRAWRVRRRSSPAARTRPPLGAETGQGISAAELGAVEPERGMTVLQRLIEGHGPCPASSWSGAGRCPGPRR